MHSDWIDLFGLFEKHGVRSLIIGGVAGAFHGHERCTKGINVRTAPDAGNAARVYAAHKEFGAPVSRLRPTDFEDVDSFVVIGAEPFRIGILMGPPGVAFEDAWRNRVSQEIDGTEINYVCLDDLIALKRAAGRPVDKLDVAALRLFAPKPRKSIRKGAAKPKGTTRKQPRKPRK